MAEKGKKKGKKERREGEMEEGGRRGGRKEGTKPNNPCKQVGAKLFTPQSSLRVFVSMLLAKSC